MLSWWWSASLQTVYPSLSMFSHYDLSTPLLILGYGTVDINISNKTTRKDCSLSVAYTTSDTEMVTRTLISAEIAGYVIIVITYEQCPAQLIISGNIEKAIISYTSLFRATTVHVGSVETFYSLSAKYLPFEHFLRLRYIVITILMQWIRMKV